MTELGAETGAHRRDRNFIGARTPDWSGAGSRSSGVADAVANALYWDLALPRYRVVARCEEGWVTLTGEVERAYQRSCAEADVMRVNGVKGVTNAITVGGMAATEPSPRHA